MITYDEDTAFSLADDAATVSALVRRTDQATLQGRRFGEWTALEALGHLADSAEIFAERVRRCLEEVEPVIASFDQDAIAAERRNATGDPIEFSRRMQRAHQSIVQLMLRPGASLRTGVHAEWGKVTAAHFAGYQARHSREHVAELGAAFPPRLGPGAV